MHRAVAAILGVFFLILAFGVPLTTPAGFSVPINALFLVFAAVSFVFLFIKDSAVGIKH